MHQLIIRALITLIISLGSANIFSVELVDRVLAVVVGRAIMLSDLRSSIEFGFVDVSSDSEPSQTEALTQLIERELIRVEVNRYLVVEPGPGEVDKAFGAIQARFDSDQHFQSVLAEFGLSDVDVRSLIRDDIRIGLYLDQRFPSAIQPTDQEVIAYYEQHKEEFTSGGRLVPFLEVRAMLENRLSIERREDLIADWVSGLKVRYEIIIVD